MQIRTDQKIEISHDMLAGKIYDRIGVEEKMRLKMVDFVNTRYAYYQESGVLLGKKELDYLAPYLGKIVLNGAQQQFLRKSRRAVKKKANLRKLFLFSIMGVLAIFLVVALSLWRSAEASRRVAQASELETRQVNQALEQQQMLALEARDQARRNARQADSLAREAEAAAALAQKQRSIALLEKSRAETAENNTRQVLRELEQSNMLVGRFLVEEAKADLLGLQYDEAGDKLRAAIALGADSEWVSTAQLEVAFWYTETGQLPSAIEAVKGIRQLLGRDTTFIFPSEYTGPKERKQYLRRELQLFFPDAYELLKKRYFPDMISIEGGTFQMGCDPALERDCKPDEQPLHPVSVSNFRMARTETTFWQFGLFCAATGRDVATYAPAWGIEGNNPAVNISWLDAVAYTAWLSAYLDLAPVYTLQGIPDDPRQLNEKDIDRTMATNWEANGFRLPTEAEWEYAARGGQLDSNALYVGGDSLDSLGWYSENSGRRSQAVGTKQPNELGIYDLSGNVDEWCWDRYGADYYQESPARDPRGATQGAMRVLRGGSWYSYDFNCRISGRHISGTPDVRYEYNGFRLAQRTP